MGAKLTIEVDCGDGAVMSIIDPRSFNDGGVEWRLRYGSPDEVRYIAAGLMDSYDYLLGDGINQKEAIRRLRLMRAARRLALQESPDAQS